MTRRIEILIDTIQEDLHLRVDDWYAIASGCLGAHRCAKAIADALQQGHVNTTALQASSAVVWDTYLRCRHCLLVTQPSDLADSTRFLSCGLTGYWLRQALESREIKTF